MANKQFRIPSENNSPLVVGGVIQNDIVDFKLSGAIINPMETYLSFKMEIREPSSTSNLSLMFNGITGQNYFKCHQSALVRDAYLFLGSKGKVEERLDADTINSNLKLYTETNQTLHNARKGNPFAERDFVAQSVINNPFRIFSRDTVAQQVVVECQILLSDILSFCETDYLDLNVMGEMHLYLKLNLDRLTVVQNLGGVAVNPSFGGAVGGITPFWNSGAPAYGAMGSVTPATTTRTQSLTTNRLYSGGINFCPFWVGQDVLLSYTKSVGANIVNGANKITAINETATGALQLTFETALKDATNETLTAITLTGANVANINTMLNVREAELVVKSTAKQSKPAQYEFMTYDIEKDSTNQSFHKRTYELAPGCIGVAVLFPSANRLSFLAGIEANGGRPIKIVINNEDITQGHVLRYDSTMDKDLKSKFFLNMGYSQVNGRGRLVDARSSGEIHSGALYFPVPESDMVQTLTLEIDNGQAIGDINIYKWRVVNI